MSAFVRELVGRPGRNGGRSTMVEIGVPSPREASGVVQNTDNDRRDLFEDRLEMVPVPVRGWDRN